MAVHSIALTDEQEEVVDAMVDDGDAPDHATALALLIASAIIREERSKMNSDLRRIKHDKPAKFKKFLKDN